LLNRILKGLLMSHHSRRKLSPRLVPRLMLAALFGLGAPLALAQQAVAAPQNVVSLAATGQVEATQDTLAIHLNTTKEGSDAQAVQLQLKQAVESALALAKPAAQSGAMEVRTGQFNLHPRYGREGRDFARISTTAGKIQSLTVQNVGYSLSREQRQSLEAQAQEKAIESFRTKAQGISKAFGFGGYSLREVSVNAQDVPQYGPRPRVMMMAAKVADAESAVPVEAGKTVVTVVVNGSVQLKPLRWLLSADFCTLPSAVLGRASRMTMRRGCL
jgi:predicted secreted protein